MAQVRGEDWDRAMPAHEIRAAHTKNKRIEIGLLKKERGCHKNIIDLAGLSIRAALPPAPLAHIRPRHRSLTENFICLLLHPCCNGCDGSLT